MAKELLRDWNFVKIGDVELMFLLGELNKFLSVFPPLFFDLGDIREQGYAFNSIQDFWASRKSAEGSSCFSYCRK